MLICTIICAIISVASLCLNIAVINSNKTTVETSKEGITLDSLVHINAMDLSNFDRKLLTDVNGNPYNFFYSSTNLFGLGEEELAVKEVNNKRTLAKVTITPSKSDAASLSGNVDSIVAKLKEEGQIEGVAQILKLVGGKTEKIENLSPENLNGAERYNVALKLSEKSKGNIITMNISILQRTTDGQTGYEISVNYVYEKTTTTTPNNATTPTETPDNTIGETNQTTDETTGHEDHNHD